MPDASPQPPEHDPPPPPGKSLPPGRLRQAARYVSFAPYAATSLVIQTLSLVLLAKQTWELGFRPVFRQTMDGYERLISAIPDLFANWIHIADWYPSAVILSFFGASAFAHALFFDHTKPPSEQPSFLVVKWYFTLLFGLMLLGLVLPFIMLMFLDRSFTAGRMRKMSSPNTPPAADVRAMEETMVHSSYSYFATLLVSLAAAAIFVAAGTQLPASW